MICNLLLLIIFSTFSWGNKSKNKSPIHSLLIKKYQLRFLMALVGIPLISIPFLYRYFHRKNLSPPLNENAEQLSINNFNIMAHQNQKDTTIILKPRNHYNHMMDFFQRASSNEIIDMFHQIKNIIEKYNFQDYGCVINSKITDDIKTKLNGQKESFALYFNSHQNYKIIYDPTYNVHNPFYQHQKNNPHKISDGISQSFCAIPSPTSKSRKLIISHNNYKDIYDFCKNASPEEMLDLKNILTTTVANIQKTNGNKNMKDYHLSMHFTASHGQTLFHLHFRLDY
jgi:hypothetical protein